MIRTNADLNRLRAAARKPPIVRYCGPNKLVVVEVNLN